METWEGLSTTKEYTVGLELCTNVYFSPNWLMTVGVPKGLRSTSSLVFPGADPDTFPTISTDTAEA